MDICIKNARMSNGTEKDIYIKKDIIAKITDKGSDLNSKKIFDCAGKYVLPGLIDINCNICDPGYEYKEDILTASEAAAKGGYTSIACSPLTLPVIDNKTVVTYIKNKTRMMSKVNIFPLGSMTKGGQGTHMSEIGEMYKAGIAGISDGNMCIKDANLLRTILIYSTAFELPVITFCECPDLAANGVMNRGFMSTYMGLTGKPPEAEEISVARNIILAKNNNAHLHITHISTAMSVELIRFAKKSGFNVTCDTCPHYFLLTEEAVNGYNTFAKVNPPLRAKKDTQEIIKGIEDGTIDAITTGHSPTNVENKLMEFDQAAFGISSLETAFALSYTALVKTNKLSLDKLIEKMSSNPANVLKLQGKGKIEEGYHADLIIVDLDAEYKISSKEFESKAKFSPHDGSTVTGKVIHTFVRGVNAL